MIRFVLCIPAAADGFPVYRNYLSLNFNNLIQNL